MAFNLILNSGNVVSGSNNTTFKYDFIGGNFKTQGYEICVSALTMPYSWYNVSQFYRNTNFTITFPTTASQTTAVNVVLPDGFYSVTDIQNYLQQICIQNGFYLINATGQYVFYTYMTYSATFYKVQLVQTPVPNALPVGWTTPVGFQGFNAASVTPTLGLAAGSIAPIIGFASGTSYPAAPSATAVNFLSTTTPVGSTVNSLVVRCSLISNPVTSPSDIMDGFPINASFGSNITYDPSFEKWVDIKDGTFSSLTLQIVDQNLNTFQSLDPNVAITLLIRKRR